ncbi:MAG: hypothetical protein Q9221_001868 [Calogaya cf. arnoldii]
MSPSARLISNKGPTATSQAARFLNNLLQIWRPPVASRGLPGPVRFALAVSGGSDSMALVKMCCQLRELREQYPVLQFLRLHAFIVDHKVRPDSTEEARQVRKWLHEQFGPNKDQSLRSDILTLKWPPGVIPSELPNFETEARKLRYRALGKACHEANIPSLLLGHHEADKKETLILRLIEGYRGEGLRRMPAESYIPECQGIYGAYLSGGRDYISTQNESAKNLFSKRKGAVEMLSPVKEYRKQGFEFGGVRVFRPLLAFSKRKLQEDLIEANVPWVEDPTNQDPTISVRNAIRFLIRDRSLPMALSGRSTDRTYTLETAAENIYQRYQWRNERADELFQALDIITFDSRVGSLEVRILPMGFNTSFLSPTKRSEQEHIGARVVRRLLQIVSPQDHISLQNLETATKSMLLDTGADFPGHGNRISPLAALTAGSVYCERVSLSNDTLESKSGESHKSVLMGHTWRLSRQPYHRKLPEAECYVPPAQPSSYNPQAKKQQRIMYPEPPWQLWDGRYWIQVINTTSKPLKICPLTEDRLLRLRTRISAEACGNTKNFATLQNSLRRAAPGSLRFTLPAIVDDEDNVLVLPSLRFEIEGLAIEWRIRYRRVTFPDKIERESIIAMPEKEFRTVKGPAITAHHQDIIDQRREEKAQRKTAEKLEKERKKAEREEKVQNKNNEMIEKQETREETWKISTEEIDDMIEKSRERKKNVKSHRTTREKRIGRKKNANSHRSSR